MRRRFVGGVARGSRSRTSPASLFPSPSGTLEPSSLSSFFSYGSAMGVLVLVLLQGYTTQAVPEYPTDFQALRSSW